jgi:membrane-associated protease RseP (regulator of RpoE activity)
MEDPFHTGLPQKRLKDRLKPLIPLALFVATVFTTLVAGAMQQGVNPLEEPQDIWKGIPFAFTLLLILGSHEFGHYFVSRHHHVEATFPYFIPAPTFIGTFGAVIRMKSPIMDRQTLLDIGVAGPLAGIVVSIPALFLGLSLSEVVPSVPEGGLSLGTSILFSLINWVVNGAMPADTNLVLHPVAFAGWIGLLVTSLNLLPVGQLDGGHVTYAIFGRRQQAVAKAVMIALFFLGVLGWTGWLFWGAILMIMGINHPPVVYDWIPLDGRRKIIGWLTLMLFVMTFTPIPF